METYRKYFNIDPDYFPAVNEDVIKKEPDLWKKYYPHETFVKLLKQMVNVLERKQKLNIWVEGAYGTGKSHAVLTLKHLLDADNADVEAYFKTFGLDQDLCNKLLAVKSQGRVVTVHRYGSSEIHSDNDLFLAMQESIENALYDAGITNAGPNALKDGIIKYLSDSENKQSFGVYVEGSYKELFAGDSVDDIVNHLGEYTGQALLTLMNKIFRVANEKNIKAFTLDSEMMVRWIAEVIHANNLKALVFIWDEFTEYFSNNAHRLTGLQRILDFSQTEPFCFIPVTHRSEAGIDDADSDKPKILGRFIKPTCIIELPENMAFQLMGAAMQVVDDPVVSKDWNEILFDLEERTIESRKRIKQSAGIDDKELRGILPIHPYAACLLKHISASFASNQRSMFDFIKNGGNEDLKGFQWYIDNFGPLSDNPFLTVDLLWGFFYDNGKNDLSMNIRQILDRFTNLSKQLDEEECKVLKAILLFQAMSLSAGDQVEIFLPNEKNLNLSFEGSDLEDGQAVKCAEKLVRDKIIYKKTLKDGSFLYSVLTGEMDANQIDKKKAEFESRTTSSIIKGGQLDDTIEIPQDLRLRFKVEYAACTDFDIVAKKNINNAADDNRHFYIVACFSKTASESMAMVKKIREIREKNQDNEVIFVDLGKTPLTEEKFEEWVTNMATSSYYTGKDNAQSAQYNQYGNSILTEWRTRIRQGQFVLYSKENPQGETFNSIDALGEELRTFDRKRFSLSLECNYKSINNWWFANSLQVGVECGVNRVLKSTYNNNNAKLSTMLANAWDNPNYWTEHPADPISRIKVALKEYVDGIMDREGRISIRTIYDFLKDAPYGFLPCNMTAFFMGFLLKEYVDDKYSWSDGLSSDNMSLQKMKEMVEEVIKNDNTPNNRYRDKFIVTMTPEEKSFIEGTSMAFDIAKTSCSSVEAARDRIRGKMKQSLYFPIWTVAEVLCNVELKSSESVVKNLIENYQDLANNTTDKSDTEIANAIGRAYMANPCAAEDLHNLLTEENCKKGMLKYLDRYNDGKLPMLAKAIGDNGQYINCLKKKFDAGEANWVWKRETVNQQIDAVILEYQITEATGKLLGSCKSYKESIGAWKEKIDNIKLAYETIKNDVDDLLPLLGLLKELKMHGSLQDNKKILFLEQIENFGGLFNSFYISQFDVFCKSCDFYLQNLNDADKEKVFGKLQGGCFCMDNATYCNMVGDTVAQYRKELGSIRLKSIWKEKTGTESPRKWSDINKMPILAMLPDTELAECRIVFGIINNPNPSDKDIDKALTYLDKFTHWDELCDDNAKDKAFSERFLVDMSVLLPNAKEVRDYIASHTTESAYSWMGNPQVHGLIEKIAEARYNAIGCEKAIHNIDMMPADEVKKYLKELIKNNMKVGIQILKNN